MDFGLAKILQSPAVEALVGSETDVTVARELTTPGFTMGTVSYMSPEQARGEDVDARADLFAFGALLYDMAIGEPPFRGSTPAVILSGVLERQPVAPLERDEPRPGRQEIILKALEKKPRGSLSVGAGNVVDLGASCATWERTMERVPRCLAHGSDPIPSGSRCLAGQGQKLGVVLPPSERPCSRRPLLWKPWGGREKPDAAAASRPEIKSLVSCARKLSQDRRTSTSPTG